MAEGCGKSAQRGVYCAMHGGVRLCSVDGCVRNVRGNGLCAVSELAQCGMGSLLIHSIRYSTMAGGNDVR